MQNKLVIENINVKFTSEWGMDITALEDINLSVKVNEFVCIMGPSGCGKTTLLNVLAGLLKPSSGSVKLDGIPISQPGPDRVMVFQDDAVFPWMTVEDNVAFGLSCKKESKEKKKKTVDHFIEVVGLSDFRKAWPKQLSGGMRKRVDLARAYATNPEVMLLDEPFGPLDIMTKERLQEDLLALWNREPRTVVFITHDVEEALFLGERVVVMTPRPGKIYTIIEPCLPKERDNTIKMAPMFVDLRRQICEILKNCNERIDDQYEETLENAF